jgi:putative glutathione S-transferase
MIKGSGGMRKESAMGMMHDGQWQSDDLRSAGASFVRPQTVFRNWVTADGRPGPSGGGGFKAERGRYHLYVSLACPWAHRTLIVRRLKKLDDAITVSVVDPFMGDVGWAFSAPDGSLTPGATRDDLSGARYLHEIYTRARRDYTGRVTVPVLWDRETRTIVNNESSEIIRMFNSAFDAAGAAGGDLYPQAERAEIDELNAIIYDTLNNGVYKCGFAKTQAAYEAAFDPLFETLDRLENAWRAGATSSAPARRRLIGGCSPRWFVSMLFTIATSNATCAASLTIPIYGATRATCTRCPAWPKRSASRTSNVTITRATR